MAEMVEAKAIFDRHDKDHDGYITTRELRHAGVLSWLHSTVRARLRDAVPGLRHARVSTSSASCG